MTINIPDFDINPSSKRMMFHTKPSGWTWMNLCKNTFTDQWSYTFLKPHTKKKTNMEHQDGSKWMVFVDVLICCSFPRVDFFLFHGSFFWCVIFARMPILRVNISTWLGRAKKYGRNGWWTKSGKLVGDGPKKISFKLKLFFSTKY